MRFLLSFVLALCLTAPLFAQDMPDPNAEAVVWVPRVPQKAFALSLLVPGLGHRYAQSGSWRGGATRFALVEAGLWAGLFTTQWRRNHLIQSFETLAATSAGADIAGKDRTFFLNLAAFMSSDEYLNVQLRNRAWEQVDYVADRSFQWQWESEEAYVDYRRLRDDAESLKNRRVVIGAALVANRLLAGLMAVRAANRANRRAADVTFGFAAPPPGSDLPALHIRVGF